MMSPVFKNRNILLDTKLRVPKCYVWSILLYGSECWTISRELETRLKATEMWFLRRILRISWTEMKSNAQVLEMAGTQRALMNTVRRKQLEFLGHVLRKDELEKLVFCGKIEGKRSRGRQRTSFSDSLRDMIPNTSKTELIRLADDRERWRVMIVDVCSRPDT